jgi:Raf kinase inhibitor-like YbhB/YbcL family protein
MYLSLALWVVVGMVGNMSIISPAFDNGAFVPTKYTCNGQNISPKLSWENAPPGTQSFALIMDDPDAPNGTWDHWILYDIPSQVRELKEDIKELPKDAHVGKSSSGKNEYGGPCPPADQQHRYYFTLYALDTKLNLSDGISKMQLEQAMSGHILSQSQLIALYRRNSES